MGAVTIYAGGESSRVYEGTWRVAWKAQWPIDSAYHAFPAEGETQTDVYEVALAAVTQHGGMTVTLVGPKRYEPGQTGRWVVYVTSAIIERVS